MEDREPVSNNLKASPKLFESQSVMVGREPISNCLRTSSNCLKINQKLFESQSIIVCEPVSNGR